MSALEAAPEGSATATGSAHDGASAASSAATSAASGAAGGGAAVVVAPPVVVVVAPPPPSTTVVSCPSVAVAAMSVLSGAENASSSVGDALNGRPASPLNDHHRMMTGHRTPAHEARGDALWRRSIPREIREELARLMREELQRITGQGDTRHLRICAARYEAHAWRRCQSQVCYFHKMRRRIESLREQPSFDPERSSDLETSSSEDDEDEGDEVEDEEDVQVEQMTPDQPALHYLFSTPLAAATPQRVRSRHRSASTRRLCRQLLHAQRHHRHHRDAAQHLFPGVLGSVPPSLPLSSSSSSSSSPSSSTPPSTAASLHQATGFPTTTTGSPTSAVTRDERYFRKLRIMKAKYRDEVALVYRELCRVNTVIQHSASLRRHESNNLGDFLANLKKIIYLLEQQPDEMSGMIPARKRTLEYLDVVESHIQRKVLPILYRLRHTYSTILRPIVLNYLKNSGRFSRR